MIQSTLANSKFKPAIGIMGWRAGDPNIIGCDIGIDMTSLKGCDAIGCGCCVIGWALAGEPPSDILMASSRSSNADLGGLGGGGRAGDADIVWLGFPIPMNGFGAAACTRNTVIAMFLQFTDTQHHKRIAKILILF